MKMKNTEIASLRDCETVLSIIFLSLWLYAQQLGQMPGRQKFFLEFLQNLHLELSSDQESKNGFADEHERLWFLRHKVESTMEYFEENLHKFCKLASAAPPEYQDLSTV